MELGLEGGHSAVVDLSCLDWKIDWGKSGSDGSEKYVLYNQGCIELPKAFSGTTIFPSPHYPPCHSQSCIPYRSCMGCSVLLNVYTYRPPSSHLPLIYTCRFEFSGGERASIICTAAEAVAQHPVSPSPACSYLRLPIKQRVIQACS